MNNDGRQGSQPPAEVTAVGNREPHENRLSHARLSEAAQTLRQDGYLILEDSISPAQLDPLRERMEEDTRKIWAARRKDGHTEPRFLQRPPPFAPYVPACVVAHPSVAQITREVLGKGVYCNLYSANTNCPGSAPQPVHVDVGQLWQGLEIGHPPATLVVNIPLVESSEENGTIELWPGTHLDPRPSFLVDRGHLAERWAISPPIAAELPLGSVLIRDPRLWHRGLPNRSDRVRHMLTMNHNVFWLERGPRTRFVKGCEAAFNNTDLRWHVEFVDELFDYLTET